MRPLDAIVTSELIKTVNSIHEMVVIVDQYWDWKVYSNLLAKYLSGLRRSSPCGS